MADFVVVVTLPGTTEHFTKAASGKLTVGRTEDSDIWLGHPTVSRPHAEIESPQPGEFLIRDLGSRNGTEVNGRLLQNGDLTITGTPALKIGPYLLTLSSPISGTETVMIEKGEAFSRVRLDRGLRALTRDGQVILDRLSGLEYRLIDALDTASPRVVENTKIGDHLWGEGQWDVYMLHNLIRRIRRKLEEKDLEGADCLITVPGVGYRLG